MRIAAKRILRSGAAVSGTSIAVVLGAGVTALPAGALPMTSHPYVVSSNVRGGHGHAMPTVTSIVDGRAGFLPGHANKPIPGPLVYQGGQVDPVNEAVIYVDFWGWTSDPSGEKAVLTKFLGAVQPNPWTNIVSQYCEGVASGSQTCGTGWSVRAGMSPAPLGGVWNDPSVPTTNPGNPGGGDGALQTEVDAAYAHFSPTIPAGKIPIFLIATPSGIQTSGSGFGAAPPSGWCAYHNTSGDGHQYIDLPYITDAGVTCGEDLVNGAAGLDDGVTIVAGHELAETLTDPQPGSGWVDSSGWEIGDKCAWYHLKNIPTSNGTFPVQPLWGNQTNGCEINYSLSLPWYPSGIGVTDMSIGADGVVWAISNVPALGGFAVYRAPGINLKLIPMPGGGVDIAVDPKGNAWMVDAGHNIYAWAGGKFNKQPGKALEVSIGADGAVWIVSPLTTDDAGDHALCRWTMNGWTKEPGGAVDIAVDPSGNPWIIDAKSHIYHFNGVSFVSVPGSATDIAVDNNGLVWILGTTKITPSGFRAFVRINTSWVGLNTVIGVDIAAYNGYLVNITSDPFTFAWSPPF